MSRHRGWSRISRGGGGGGGGGATNSCSKFSEKLHENENIWSVGARTWGGPLGSATGTISPSCDTFTLTGTDTETDTNEMATVPNCVGVSVQYQHLQQFYPRHFYHPRMRVGNVFSHVCLCVCLCVCLSVHLCVCPFIRLSVRFYVSHTVVQAGGLHSTEMRSCLFYFRDNIIVQSIAEIFDILS